MSRILLTALSFLILPTSVFAAQAPALFSAERSILATNSSPGNAYFAGLSIIVAAPVAGDLSAVGGSIVSAAPVYGDDLFFAGSISSRARVGGNFRALGESINIEEPIVGDLVACGFSVHDSNRVSGSTLIIAANTTLTNGATGPVTIYGNNISLAGDFTRDVTVIASGNLILAPNTTIEGRLFYEAPEKATIPSSSSITGGVEYKNASYLPDAGTSRTLALLSVGFFLFARIFGALILAGLFAGLFPKLSETVIERAYTKGLRGILLAILLGFAVFVVTPVLFVLLMLTFVGIGLALLLLLMYLLLILLSLLYAGILLGGIYAQSFLHRNTIFWHDGVLGMLALSLIALVPEIGLFLVLLLTLFSSGVLLKIFFQFAFPHKEYTSEML